MFVCVCVCVVCLCVGVCVYACVCVVCVCACACVYVFIHAAIHSVHTQSVLLTQPTICINLVLTIKLKVYTTVRLSCGL